MIEVRDLSGNGPFVAPRGSPGSPAGTVVTDTLSGDGTTDPVALCGNINIHATGNFDAGTLTIQRSLDGKSTWLSDARDSAGTVASYTDEFSLSLFEPENHAYYRTSIAVAGAPSITVRIGTTPMYRE